MTESTLVGILSDSQGRAELAARAAELFAARRVARVFHCGDIGDLSVIDALLNLTVTYVFGNIDHSRPALRRYIQMAGATVGEPHAEAEVAGKRIAVIHGDDGAALRRLIDGQQFDYVFCGHTHVARNERVGRSHVINPGALHRARTPTVAILDLAADQLEILPLAATQP